MSQLCALKQDDFMAILKAFGGVASLKASMGTEENPNFDEITRFVETVVRSAPPSALRLDVTDQLQVIIDKVFRGTKYIQLDGFVGLKVYNFWKSAPFQVDNTTEAVNSANQNITSEEDAPKKGKIYGIGNYFSNVNYIKEFNKNFQDSVNELLFEFTNMQGIVVSTSGNLQLNEAIKTYKNSIAAKLVNYLWEEGVTTELSADIYNPETLEFNEKIYNDLIKEAGALIKDDNYFLNAPECKRLAFGNLEMLRNFDTYVDSILDNVITIEKGYKHSAFEPADGIKYKLSNKLHVDKHFGDEDSSDIFRHINDSIRVFIESIPYLDSFARKEKRLTQNLFITIFSKLNLTLPVQMAKLRFAPEESLMKILDTAMSDPTKYLEDRVYLKNHLEGIHRKFSSVYSRERTERFSNNLYPMLASYINKLTNINYVQQQWDKRTGAYEAVVLSNLADTRLKSNLEKRLQVHSKYNDFSFANKVERRGSSFIITTTKGIYTIPLNGTDMTILDNSSRNTLTAVDNIFDFIMDSKAGDEEFTEIISEVFDNQIDAEILTIAYNSYQNEFMKVFNLVGNVLLNQEFGRGTRNISGTNAIKRNTDYYLVGEGATYRFIAENNIGYKEKNAAKIQKRIFDPVLGTLRVAGFNQGTIGRDVIYKALSDVNGDSTRSYVTGAAGNMMSLTRLPNLVNIDKVTFAELKRKEDNSFIENNLFSDLFDIATDTQLKTTITTRDGKVAKPSQLSVADLLLSQIMFDYSGNKKSIYVQPVAFSDKQQIWLKGIDRNKKFTYEGTIFEKGLGNASAAKIQDLHFRTMSKMFSNLLKTLVADYNSLFKYLIPGQKAVTSYDEGVKVLLKFSKDTKQKDLTEAIYHAVKKAKSDGVDLEIYQQIHYPVIKGVIAPNETLAELFKIFGSFETFFKNQKLQKKLWTYIAVKEGLRLDATFTNGADNSVLQDFGKGIPNYKRDWVDAATGEYVLYKVKRKKNNATEYVDGMVKYLGQEYDTSHHSFIDAIKFDDNFTIELNPEVDKFFEINGLITNHYTAATVGLPYIHPIKSTYDKTKDQLLKQGVSLNDITQAVITKMEAARTAAHSKRMVIYGSTLHPYIQLKFDGIPENYNIACLKDKTMAVFNIQGETESGLEQFNGGVLTNPFLSIWEANSLPELALSPIHRKSIMFMPNSKYLASGLGKWATFSFNNEMIRKASSNNQIAISGHNLMKKMTNHNWIVPNLDITDGGNIRYSGLMYYDKNLHQFVRINGIERIGIELDQYTGKITNNYKIDRLIVNNDGSINAQLTEANQTYFNGLKNTINSNYDLWKTLGGEYSVSIKSNGINNFLDWSETSVEKVADVASKISIRRSNADVDGDFGYETYLEEIRGLNAITHLKALRKLQEKFPENKGEVDYTTQSYYVQPMKHSDIHYVAPETSIKNGVANINPDYVYNYDDYSLNSWSVPSLYLGIQLNSEHHVDNSEVSEMSQVISALAELGTTHNISNLAYKSIGQSVVNNLADLKVHLSSESTEVNDQIYYILGKALCESFVKGKGWEDISLANAYLSLVLLEFGKSYKDWKKQAPKFKLPFDDPNIFDAFTNSFTSGKNRDAIKRTYSGLQAILMPAQDLNTLYMIDGRMMSYEDLLMDETKVDRKTGLRIYANADDRLAALDVPVDVHEIVPGDYVELDKVTYLVQGFKGGPKIDRYILNPEYDAMEAEIPTMEDPNDPMSLMIYAPNPDYNVPKEIPIGGKVGLSYVRNLRGSKVIRRGSQGSNLKDANFRIKLNKENAANIAGGYLDFDVWDLDTAKLAHNLKELLLWLDNGQIDYQNKNLEKLKDRRDFYKLKEGDPDPIITDDILELRAILTEVLNKSIKKWKVNHFNGEYNNDLKYINDILQQDIDNMEINHIFPIPIKSRTDLEVREAVIDSIENDPFLVMIGATQASSFGLRAGDSVLEILDRKEEFFLDRFTQNHQTLAKKYDAYLVSHTGSHLHILSRNDDTERTLNSILATPLEIETETEGDTTYRLIDGKRAYVINVSTDWYQVPLANGQVYEYIVVDGANEVKGIINSGIYDAVSENKNITASDIAVNAANTELNRRDKLILGLFRMSPTTSREEKAAIKLIETPEQYLAWITQRVDGTLQLDNAKKRYQAFLQYLDFIVARIPAQSMQSFMNMRIVGFINTPTNVALVPAIQLWIQGSDLDIDKAFMLGASISEAGYYNDWSELFNYTDRKTVDASNELPIPDLKTRVLNEELEYGKGLTEDSNVVSLFTDEYGNEFDTTSVQMLDPSTYTAQTTADPTKIIVLAKLIDNILNLKVKSLNLNPGLVELINLHTEALNLDKYKLNEALKNKIWFLAKKSGANIRNLQAQMSPISITQAQDAAANSTSGKDSNIISLMNTASTMMLQLENSIGRDCIGIAATGSKIASAILRHYNELARLVNAGILQEEDIFIPEKKYPVDGNENGIVSKPTFNNINWANVPKLKDNPDPEGIYNKMLEHGVPANVLNLISILITISTDNAKELILQKIGATKDLMSIYVYGLLIGEDFATLANFMVKPEISMVLKKAVASLTDDSKKDMNIARAVQYYQEKVDPSMYGMGGYLGGIDELYLMNFQATSEEGKLSIKEKATKIFNARRKAEEGLEESERSIKNDATVDSIKFDDLLGGKVTDKKILTLQRELVELLVNLVRTEALTVTKSERKEKKASRYRSDFLEEEIDDDIREALYEAMEDEYIPDEEEEGAKSSRNSNLKGYVRYLNEVKSRINDLLQFKDLTHVYSNIETMYKLKSDSEGVTLLGRFLSINQGVPTKHVDRLNKMFGIEDTVTSKLRGMKFVANNDGISMELNVPEFSIMEFFSNKEKQKMWIDAYTRTGEAFNVLKVVTESPHFSEMWGAFVTIQQAMDNQTIKSKLTETLTRRLKRDGYAKKLTLRDVSQVKGFIQDCFVHKFLSRYFENKPINIPSNVRMVYNDTGQLVDYKQGSKESFDLRNTYDRMSFKFWFETEYLKAEKDKYKTNMFLKHLGITTYPNNLGEPETLAVLPINMMSAKDADKDALTIYNNHFILIKDVEEKVGDEFIGSDSHHYTNGELFFLYNLLVNKNRFGESSLTKIFDTSIWEYKNNPKKAGNIITDYFNFERDLLENPNFKFTSEDYNYRDLELRFAPFVRKGMETSTRYYYRYGENGKEYYVREEEKGSKVRKPAEKVVIISSSLNLQYLLQDARFKGTETTMKLSDRLKLLIYNNKIEIKFVECHG